jgi:hypothetical protein
MRSPRSSRSSAFSRPIAELVGAAIDPVLARQGFSQSDIILLWDEIVGPRLAAMSEPLCLRWPPRGRAATGRSFAPATLVVRVESGFALEMQHLSGLVMERINAHLGFACVGRVSLKQGPLARLRSDRPQRKQPAEAAFKKAAASLPPIENEALREALTRLGAYVLEGTGDVSG